VTVPGRQLAPHDRISLSGLATERKVGIGETDCVASMLEDKRGPSLRQNRAAINDANQGLGGAVNDIAAVARHSNQRLRDIQAESRPACGHWSRPWTLQPGNRWPHS
jgi:hypothetical protein